MNSGLHRHLRSNIVGYVGLFFALTGGVAWATHPGGANTISTADIINSHVRTADIGNNQVRSVDVRDDTLAAGGLNASDLNEGSVGGSEILDQSIVEFDIGSDAIGGDEVVTGGVDSRGILDGGVGASDLGFIWRRTRSVTVPDQSSGSVSVDCLPGEKLISGSATWDSASLGHLLVSSEPFANSWFARGYNGSGASRTLRAYALCLGDGTGS